MLQIIKKRALQLIIVLFFLSLLTFVLMKLAPGDPVLLMLEADTFAVTQEDEDALRKELGFDKPVIVQYGMWLLQLLKFDLGYSYLKGKPVLEEIMYRLPATLQLTAGGLFVMVLIAVPLGTLSARYRGKLPDHFSRIFALTGASVPLFWMGLLLIYLFAYKLQWLPMMGKGTITQMILPSLTLGLGMAAEYSRLLRAGLLESLSEQYIRAARARGIAEWRVLSLHAMRAALLPVITVCGMSIGSLLAGSVVTETLFSWPGLGTMAVSAIFERDYPIIQGFVLLTGLLVVGVNLLVDLSYGLLDPRIRKPKGELS
ncbi:peptide/nickel transport system permease protein [Paenibacillus prosopidis]|uniref:Nickel import system permease protein NikB n=1 Tax=Paenibacillus prosopidis TaxID=630520 RepID=A0A368VPF4_9BACL|nr:peptide/nickel transport system permease protein [Paenibacillus prosopidis]